MEKVDFTQGILAIQPDLHRFAYKLTADRESANDLVQDCLLQYYYDETTKKINWLELTEDDTVENLIKSGAITDQPVADTEEGVGKACNLFI